MLFKVQQTLKQIVTLASKELEQANLFFGHGTDNSWDEACWLIETLTLRSGREKIDAEMTLDKELLEQIESLLTKRIKEKLPLAYLLNEAWFAGLPFYVNEKVIIPRSPIAELIKSQFQHVVKQKPKTVLDMCCGSGCIGIASAVEFPASKVKLVDLSEQALEVAALNVSKFELTNRVTLLSSDLFAEVEGRFDLIVSNPPYVGEKEYLNLPEEYKHEPAIALLSENNGLAIPIEILRQAANYLTDDGALLLEVGNSWQALAAKYPDAPFHWFEFEHGGEGILALRRSQLKDYRF